MKQILNKNSLVELSLAVPEAKRKKEKRKKRRSLNHFVTSGFGAFKISSAFMSQFDTVSSA